MMIYSKLMDDVYPNYRQVIPRETAEHIDVDRQLLLDALDRASVMTMDEAHSTKLIFENGKLTLEQIYKYGKKVEEPKTVSGKQEKYETIVALYCK